MRLTSDGVVRRVEFFESTNKIGEATNAPFSLTWSNVTAGQYALKAVATDDYGDTTESAVVNILMVTNTPPAVTISAPLDGAVYFARPISRSL
jgi:hypothetical protein